jgi:DNA polymerase III alpha subunit (gram-positive type)
MNKNIWIRRDACRKFEWTMKNFMGPIIFYDTETTGLKKTDYIVQLSAIKFERNSAGRYGITGKLNEFIKPPVPMPKEASDVNHITDEVLKDKPTEEEIFQKIRDFFGNVNDIESAPVISGYNITGFDNKMMNAMYGRCSNETFTPVRVVDVNAMAMECVDRKELADGSFNLTSVAGLYGIVEDTMHSSDTDTLVTAKLAWALYNDYKDNFRETVSEKPEIFIRSMYPMKKSKFCNFIMINVSLQDGSVGRLHYDIYNKKYVEDEGDIMERGNMMKFSYDADAASGGAIAKYKVKTKGRT